MHYLVCFIKLMTASAVVRLFRRDLLKENLWLFQEKHTEARDNGYHLYRYIKEKHPEIRAYYSIVKGSPDELKIRDYRTTIEADSLKHYMFWIAARYSISSQAFGAAPYPTEHLYRFRQFCRKDQQTIYLKHGIDHNEHTHALDWKATGFSLVCCAAAREQEYIMQTYGYPADVARLTGLCRYDRLMKAGAPKKQILVMPTARNWLRANIVEKEATGDEMLRFLQSDFYRNFRALLTDEHLLTSAREYGYTIVFYLHYALQSYTKAFLPLQNETVRIADREHDDVQQLMMKSAIMVTDYSSVFFDFAYMKKPEVLFQFDEAEFRKAHYRKGYFDYSKDGFGPVYTTPRDVADELIRLLGNGCTMASEYIAKAEEFYAFFDDRNCERTYRAIQHME